MVELNRAERSKREKRERIIRAARQLFLSKGFHATTTSEIPELADVAKGTLFFHLDQSLAPEHRLRRRSRDRGTRMMIPGKTPSLVKASLWQMPHA